MFLVRFPKPTSDNPTVQAVLDELDDAGAHLQRTKLQLKREKGFLWWASEANRKRVNALQHQVEHLQYRVDNRQKLARDLLVEEGHGIWSHSGMQDNRRLFWETFQAGRSAAKSNSLADSVYHLMGTLFQSWGEDSDARAMAAVFILKMVIAVVWNYTFGCLLAICFYLGQLPALIRSYRASMADGIIFFLSSALGALSISATFLALLAASIACCMFSTAVTINALTPPAGPMLTAPPVQRPAALLPPSPAQPADSPSHTNTAPASADSAVSADSAGEASSPTATSARHQTAAAAATASVTRSSESAPSAPYSHSETNSEATSQPAPMSGTGTTAASADGPSPPSASLQPEPPQASMLRQRRPPQAHRPAASFDDPMEHDSGLQSSASFGSLRSDSQQ